MKAYLRSLRTASRTDGNDLTGYLVLAVALAALPAAAVLFLLLALPGVAYVAAAGVARVACGVRDRLAELLHAGRVALADRLRDAAAVIDPRPAETAEPVRPAAVAAFGLIPPVAVVPPVASPADLHDEPRHAADPFEATPALHAATGSGAEAAPESLPLPVPMPSAARVMTAGGADTGDAADRLRALLATHGGIRAAARALGVADSTLRGRLRRHGIEATTATGRRGRTAEKSAA